MSSLGSTSSSSYDPLAARSPGQGLDHTPSYWAATAGDIPQDGGAINGSAEAEVAIIGAGYTGLSCAYHLAREYGIRATVLEANRPGWGCSGRTVVSRARRSGATRGAR